jgi:tetratricopeptide (TPR) repeat protein
VIGSRLPPVFRDREELASSNDLAASVLAALDQSGSLIVICSPNGAKSRWVNEEIRAFRRMKGSSQIHCVIIGGEPGASSKPGFDPDLESLPPALFDEGGSEPLAVDIRPGGDGKQVAKLKLIAGILGVGFDELRRREVARRHRRLAMLATASLIGLVITSGLAVFAFLSRAEALEQRDIARQKTMTSERTVAFVKSLFEVADPSQSRGKEITAREIVDQGALRLAKELNQEPAVKAELITTLGEVYLGLGLYPKADQMIRSSFELKHSNVDARARQYATLALSLNAQGNYDAATTAFTKGLELARSSDQPSPALVTRLLVGRGEAAVATDKFAEAERDIRLALLMDQRLLGPRHPDVARDLEALGSVHYYLRQYAKARSLIEQALRIRIPAQGQSHPKVSENLNFLGVIAYEQRDALGAEKYYKEALRRDEAVLGPDHPDLAFTQNNFARLLIERRRFPEALPLLRKSLAITLQQRGGSHDDLAFVYANLAMAERGIGNSDRAEAAFLKALMPARLHKHRNLGPILTDLADLYCSNGRAREGLSLLTEARPAMVASYPNDPWRTAWVDNVKGRCLIAAGKRGTGAALRAKTLPVLRDRWDDQSYYGWLA